MGRPVKSAGSHRGARTAAASAAVMLDPDLEKGDVSGGKPEDLMAELKMVLAMYNQQIDTMEANRPDIYVVPPAISTTSAPNKGAAGGSEASGSQH